MERNIDDILKNEENSIPYENHYGVGKGIGTTYNPNGSYAGINYNIKSYKYSGKDIISFNNNKCYFINDFTLYITNIHYPWIMGEIIKNDCTTQKCFLAKINKNVVIGNSLHEVLEGLRNKIKKTNNNDYDIALAFTIAHPDYNKEYDWSEMISWYILNKNLCLEGVEKFSKFANKKNGDKATPKELINLMDGSIAKNISNFLKQIYFTKNQQESIHTSIV
jgi:hypothetical protein